MTKICPGAGSLHQRPALARSSLDRDVNVSLLVLCGGRQDRGGLERRTEAERRMGKEREGWELADLLPRLVGPCGCVLAFILLP